MTETAAERIRKITYLLRSLNDGYERTKGLHLASQPGPAPSGKVPCSCVRRREEHWGVSTTGDSSCGSCGGTGWRRRIHALDGDAETERLQNGRVVLYDEYVYASDRWARPKPLPVERKLSDEPREEGFPWERRHKAFTHLSRALEALRDADEPAWRQLLAAYAEGRFGFEGNEPRLSFDAGIRCTWALGFLERRMPKPLPLPASLQELYEADERTRKVLAGRANGKSLTQIGRESGRSRRAVARSERRLSA